MAAASGRGRATRKRGPSKGTKAYAEAPSAPARYSAALVEEICQRLGEGVRWSHLGGEPDMPSLTTLYNWRRDKPDFELKVTVAMAAGATRKAERALEIAEGTTKDTVVADRLRVDTLMKHAAQMSPHEWGRKAGDTDKAREKGEWRIVVRVRDFTPVTRPDGTVFTREILPDGSFHDHER